MRSVKGTRWRAHGGGRAAAAVRAAGGCAWWKQGQGRPRIGVGHTDNDAMNDPRWHQLVLNLWCVARRTNRYRCRYRCCLGSSTGRGVSTSNFGDGWGLPGPASVKCAPSNFVFVFISGARKRDICPDIHVFLPHKDSKTTADHFKSASKNMRLQSTLLQSKCTAVVLTYAHLWGILDTDKGIVKS